MNGVQILLASISCLHCAEDKSGIIMKYFGDESNIFLQYSCMNGPVMLSCSIDA